ncbi:MAG: hypothetical protein MJ014_07165, partial [Methanocorpusculum sp.]|nr:hypothetical protein [Methanocorpusculum sp.]
AVPSAYNSQSARVVLLFGASHTKLWSIVMETLRAHVPPEKFGPTEAKITGFANGYATVLYFDDFAVTESFAEQFPRYRENFRPWAEQANGMFHSSLRSGQHLRMQALAQICSTIIRSSTMR